MTHIAIPTADTEFKILNVASKCAYGSFETRADAEEAIRVSAEADVLARAEAA